MRAMILAAGRGERMRPLTDYVPKPLLSVNGKPLIQYHLEKLKAIGVTDIVINYAWLGEKIAQYFGNGKNFGVRISYSPEVTGGLETAGGIRHALHLLGDEPFIVVNGDVYSNVDYNCFKNIQLGDALGYLLMVANPPYHLAGDFALQDGYVVQDATQKYTFSGMAMYRPEAFAPLADTRASLRPYFEQWIANKQLKGCYTDAYWCDVGTPERLAKLDQLLRTA